MNSSADPTRTVPSLLVVAARDVLPEQHEWHARLVQVLQAAVAWPRGSLALQLRLPPGEAAVAGRSEELARLLERTDPQRRVTVFWNSRAQVAAPRSHWWTHLTEDELRRGGGVSGRAVSASVHDEEAVRLAVGARFVLFAAVFAPTWKSTRVAGVQRLAQICGATRLPVLAQGGVTPARVGACLAAGARGVAVSSGVLCAPSVERSLQDYAAALSITLESRHDNR